MHHAGIAASLAVETKTTGIEPQPNLGSPHACSLAESQEHHLKDMRTAQTLQCQKPGDKAKGAKSQPQFSLVANGLKRATLKVTSSSSNS